MKAPEAFLVKYMHNGQLCKFITLEKSRAYEYAGMHHGTVHLLDERVYQHEAGGDNSNNIGQAGACAVDREEQLHPHPPAAS